MANNVDAFLYLTIFVFYFINSLLEQATSSLALHNESSKQAKSRSNVFENIHENEKTLSRFSSSRNEDDFVMVSGKKKVPVVTLSSGEEDESDHGSELTKLPPKFSSR